MIRRPPRSTLDLSSAASDVYKRQGHAIAVREARRARAEAAGAAGARGRGVRRDRAGAVSYTHLRAHETVLDIVCRLLLEKKNDAQTKTLLNVHRDQAHR